MDQERTHCEHAAARHVAIDRSYRRSEVVNRIVRENAVRMGSRQNSQWPVFCRRIIEVQTQGHYFSERLRGRMCVVNFLLNGPWAPAGTIVAFLERKCGVLVPDHKPV